MSVLFGTGEDEVLTLLGAYMTTNTAFFRSAYARGAISTGSGGGLGGGGPWQHRFTGLLAAYLAAQPANDKDFWYGFRFKGGGGFLGGLDMLYVYDTTDKPFMRLIGAGASGMTLQTSANGLTWTAYPGSDGVQPGTPEQQAFRIKKHATLGRIEWWRNGGLWYATPNFDTTAIISGSPGMVRGYAPNSNGDGYYSEIMATSADDPVVGLNLRTMAVSGAGDLSGWGGDFTRISEVSKDTSTAIQTSVSDVDSSFQTVDPGGLTSGIVIRAIVHSGEYRTATGAPQAVQPGLRIGGVNYLGASQTVNATPTPIQKIWDVSPASGAQISEAEANGTQLLVRSKA